MLNKSEILKAAWAAFRKTPSWWQVGALRAKTFADALRKAWARAKFDEDCRRKNAETAARKAEEARRAEANAPAIRAIKAAIANLEFKPFGHNIAAERRVLEAKLAGLMAA